MAELTEAEKAAAFRAQEIRLRARRTAAEAALHGDPAAANRVRRAWQALRPDPTPEDDDAPQAR